MLQTTSILRRPRLGGVTTSLTDVLGPALLLAGCLPLLVLAPTPLADWPSHLARVWITAKVLAGDAFWSARYQFNGLLIPNAILDAAVLGLMRLGLSLDAAGAAFLLLCYGAFMAGFVRLSRLAGIPLLAAASCGTGLFFTGNILDGLVNYTAGIALLLLALSFWYRPGIGVWQRLAIGLVATPCILFCHVVAALLFAGLAGCHDLFRPAKGVAQRAAGLCPATVSLAIGLLGYRLSATAGDDPGQIVYRDGPGLAGIIKGKVAIAGTALSCGNPVGDVLLAIVMGAVLLLLWRNRANLPLSRLAPVGAAAALVLLAPASVGGGSMLDFRLVVLPLVLASATLPWAARLTWSASLLLGVTASLRIVLLAAAWHGYAPLYADLERQLARLPPGSTLLAAYGDQDAFYPAQQPPLWNIASLAARHGIFVPSVFADPTQQPLAVRPTWRPDWLWSHYANARTPDRLAATTALARRFCATDPHSYLFILHADGATVALPGPNLLDGLAATRAAVIELCSG